MQNTWCRNLMLLLVLALSVGCQRFSQDFVSKAYVCGIEPQRYEGLSPDRVRLIQLQAKDGEVLPPARIAVLKAGLLRSDGQWQELTISPRACVVVDPRHPSQLVVEDQLTDEAISLSMPELTESFTKVRLKKRKAYSMRLSCPSNGYAADRVLKLNGFYAGDGEAEAGLWLRVGAQDLGVGLEGSTVLSLRDSSLAQSPFPEFLDVAALAEGSYRLVMQAGYLRPGRGTQELNIIGERLGCPLRILRKIPSAPKWPENIGNSRATVPPKLVVPLETPIGITQDPSLALETCIERITEPLKACQPTAACQEEKSFRQRGLPSLTEAGLWAVFARTRDAADHVSPLSCGTIEASGTPPEFSVRWSRSEWNKPFPLIDRPPGTIEAHIEDLKHDVLNPSDLAKNLECKVTVTSSMGGSRPAHYSRCLSGLCAGQNFRDWQPCSPRVLIDLSQEWLRSENWESSLTLHVRGDDRAGHQNEVRKTLWFSGQRLVKHEITRPTDAASLGDSTLFQRFDGTSLALQEGRIYSIGPDDSSVPKEDLQVKTMVGDRSILKATLVEDSQGVSLWGLWQFADAQSSVILGKKMGDSWIFNPTEEQGGPAQACASLARNEQGLLLCWGQSSLSVLDAKYQWNRLPFVEKGGATFDCDVNLPFQGRYAETPRGRWIVCSDDRLYLQKPSEATWESVQDPEKQLNRFKMLFVDQGLNLWLLGTDASSQLRSYVLSDSGWENRSASLDSESHLWNPGDPSFDALGFHQEPDGNVQLGFQSYDEKTKQWQSLLPDGMARPSGLIKDAKGGIWTIVGERALMRVGRDPLLIPLELVGLNPGSRLVGLSLQGPSIFISLDLTGRIILRGNLGLFRIETLDWQSFAFGFTKASAFGETWTQLFQIQPGEMLLGRENGEIARLDEVHGWTAKSIPNDRPKALQTGLKLLPVKQGFLTSSPDNTLWSWNLEAFTAIGRSDSPDGRDLMGSAVVDAEGQVWSFTHIWRQPAYLYQLKDGQWFRTIIKDVPDHCSGPLIIVDQTKKALNCNESAPVIVLDGRVQSFAESFPHLNFQESKKLDYKLVRQRDPLSLFLFLSISDFRTQQLIRYDLRTGVPSMWSVPNQSRLKVRGDIYNSSVLMDEVSLDPTTPEKFLIKSFRYILRPDGERLAVALNGSALAQSRGVALGPYTGQVLDVEMDSFGQVWILIKELGLIRYDRIGTAEDFEEKSLSRPEL